jgi:hypothetical protein
MIITYKVTTCLAAYYANWNYNISSPRNINVSTLTAGSALNNSSTKFASCRTVDPSLRPCMLSVIAHSPTP